MQNEINPDKKRHSNKKPKLALMIAGAVALLAVASFMPWEKWTNGHIRNFNLIQDITTESHSESDSTIDCPTDMDPALLEAMHTKDSSLTADSSSALQEVPPTTPAPNKIGDMVVIEDYTAGKQGLKKFKQSLYAPGIARIAVIGDSYIEGDIMTQNLRENFQKEYGGCGVGYMNMHSEFPGFRRSIKQGGDGWTEHAASKNGNKKYLGLSEHYNTPSGKATASYKGVKALCNLDKWQASKLLFIAPKSTTIKTKTTGDWEEHNITASDAVQAITINGETNNFEVASSDPSTIFLGTWLDGNNGVSVDCMSSRGYSGITLTSVNKDLCREMAQYIDYDLIILEFGINAMSAKQKDYSVYSSRLSKVIEHVRQCYPNADILLMGIGDRGEKKSGEIHSMSSVPYMIEAQRKAAMTSQCLFWDTREAMGGEDAIVEWSRQGLANKDYIHLTHKGGAKLALPLFNAIKKLTTE